MKTKEEPKQETIEEADKWSLEKAEEFALERFKSDRKKGIVTWDSILEVLKVGVKTGHKFGAKYQAERMYSEEKVKEALLQMRKTPMTFVPDKRMYSEEDVKEAFRQGQDNMDYSEMFGWDSKLTEQQWFEQFKKK
jgi:hypothetical protein